jgi:hypothetical protein
MKKCILILLAGFIFQIPAYSQITNHSPIDDIDYTCILRQQGISFFKNKLALKKGEYIDISIDVYEKGKFIENYNLLNNVAKAFGVDLSVAGNHCDYQVSKMDTTIYHRFYFFKQNNTLKIQINVPGMSGLFERNISRVKAGEIYQILDTPNNLEKKTVLGYYYGIYKNALLECPSGLKKEEMIKTYDIVIVISGEKKKE